MGIDDNFERIPPETYDRVTHPSLKQFRDFVHWLRETTLSELEAAKDDIAATKVIFVRFFHRGLGAKLLLGELMDILPSIVTRADYPEPERSEVAAMLKALNLEELGIRRNEGGVRFDYDAS